MECFALQKIEDFFFFREKMPEYFVRSPDLQEKLKSLRSKVSLLECHDWNAWQDANTQRLIRKSENQKEILYNLYLRLNLNYMRYIGLGF